MINIDYKLLSKKYKNILVTGGLGFIGSAFILRILEKTSINIFNIDKLDFKDNKFSFNNLFSKFHNRYKFFKINIHEKEKLRDVFKDIDPDIIFHFAAESHVDRSIDNPSVFIESNICGTFNLLEESLIHFKKLTLNRRKNFRFTHISTDEVYGSLNMEDDPFNENSKYSPRSPYSASKAASDHLVNSWFHTYGLPTLITNCSNNFGPRQFPDKLIPNIILNAIENKPIPIYGNGLNIRDWLYVEDHINALLLLTLKAEDGSQYCVGGNKEITNIKICNMICNLLDEIIPKDSSYKSQIIYVNDRPGHDFRYSIDTNLISRKIGWQPSFNFNQSLLETINWYKENLDWIRYVRQESGYYGQRLGSLY